MRPAVLMAISPQSEAAVRIVARMLAMIEQAAAAGPLLARGADWAAAVIPPPAHVPGCGADIVGEGGDVLLWTGDLHLPRSWPAASAGPPECRAVSQRLLARLRSQGTDCLAEADGAFCGAWYDRRSGAWRIFNDRLGLLPVFWSSDGRTLIVGPRAEWVWRAGGGPLVPDELGIVHVLRAMNAIGDRTLIEDVHWLEPGHVLIHSGEHSVATVERRCYWEFVPSPDKTMDTRAAAESYCEAFAAAVARQVDRAEPLVLGISGGLDARMILAFCTHMGVRPACFTSGPPFSPDVRYGRRLARVAGVGHTFVPWSAEDIPAGLERMIIASDGLHGAVHLANSLAIVGYLENIPGSVVLEGHAHGIFGGGAVPDDEDLNAAAKPHQTAWARKHAHAGGQRAVIDGLLYEDVARRSGRAWGEAIDERYRRCPCDEPAARAEFTVLNGRSGRNDVLGPALWRDHVLLRSPATERVVLDWCARVPGRLRRGKKIYMEVLRSRFPRFARVRRTDFSGLPVAEDRLLREYCWQVEKLYHLWAMVRYRDYLRWRGMGHYTTFWLWTLWRDRGLRMICEPGARIGAWVRPEALERLWQRAMTEPALARPLLTLGTIEVMLRRLERPVSLGGRCREWEARFRSRREECLDVVAAGPAGSDGRGSSRDRDMEHARS